jgi:hypothetical protein
MLPMAVTTTTDASNPWLTKTYDEASATFMRWYSCSRCLYSYGWCAGLYLDFEASKNDAFGGRSVACFDAIERSISSLSSFEKQKTSGVSPFMKKASAKGLSATTLAQGPSRRYNRVMSRPNSSVLHQSKAMRAWFRVAACFER